MEPDFFTVKQMMAKLNVSRMTLYRWREDGEGPPCYRVGSSVRYPKGGFNEWEKASQIVTLENTTEDAMQAG